MGNDETHHTHSQLSAYLRQLDHELTDQDPAMRHDALIDAETHLRAALAAGVSVEQAVQDFGTPEEIALAYRTSESTTHAWRGAPTLVSNDVSHIPDHSLLTESARRTSSAQWKLRDIPLMGVWFDRRAWGALLYFGIVGFALATTYFTFAVTLGAISLATAWVLVGIPLFVLLLGSARALCLFEGKVIEFFLGVRMPRRVQLIVGVDQVGFWRRIACWLSDIRSWLSLGYLLGNFPVSVLLFVITVSLTTLSAVLLGVPLVQLFGIPAIHVSDTDGDFKMIYLGQEVLANPEGVYWLPLPAVILSLGLGVVVATAELWLLRGLGSIYGQVVRAIQVSRPQPTIPPRAA